jgi:hypothetical protein
MNNTFLSQNSRFAEMSEARKARSESPDLEAISLLLFMLSASIPDNIARSMCITATIGTILKLRPDLKNKEDEIVALLTALKNDLKDINQTPGK